MSHRVLCQRRIMDLQCVCSRQRELYESDHRYNDNYNHIQDSGDFLDDIHFRGLDAGFLNHLHVLFHGLARGGHNYAREWHQHRPKQQFDES